jgi:hypothetical protein
MSYIVILMSFTAIFASIGYVLSDSDNVLSDLGTVHYLWRGVAPKRKGLGKLNFE